MAAFDTTRTPTVLSSGRIAGILSQLFGACATWNDARVTRASLSRLSARELEDIGLSRGDIDMVAARTQR